MKNNFLVLQENDEEAFNNSPNNARVYNGVESQLSVLRFLGSVFNMYVPVMADTILNVTGGGDAAHSITAPLGLEENTGSQSHSDEPLGPDQFDSDPIR